MTTSALPSLIRPGLAALVAAFMLAAATVPAAKATAGFDFDRIFGSDRYATAAAIALDAFPTGADGAVIATGEDFPDALAGSFLVGRDSGYPVLLVQKNSVPAATDQALEQLGVKTVVLLGGGAVIAPEVQAALDADYDVVRLGGTDRFDTARLIAETEAPADIGEVDNKSTAIVANGFGFADALAAGPISFAARLPILLTGPAGLAAPTRAALEKLAIEHVVIVGGEAAVSATVESEIKTLGITTQRISGADRFQTATRIADFAIDTLGFDPAHLNLAKGIDARDSRQGFADALAGAPHAGLEKSVVVLTAGDQLSPATRTWIEGRSETLASGHIFGGTGAVSSGVANAAIAAARNVAGEVVRVDKAKDTYAYVPAGSDSAVTVGYSADDRFFIDGERSSIGAFEAAIGAGDRIHFTSGTPGVHRLTEVDPASINKRTVGNVDTTENEFDFINDVTGDAIVSNKRWADGDTFVVDGDPATTTAFESDVNEGDVLEFQTDTVTTWSLTNKAVTGVVNSVASAGTAVAPATRFRIDVYGDLPDKSSDGSTDTDGAGNDTFYQADPGDAYAGDADAYDPATGTGFRDELTAGDIVTYTRIGGVETFTLNNEPLPTVKGTADSINPDGDGDEGLIDNDADGGTMTLVMPDGSQQDIDYINNGDVGFIVDGIRSTEAEFEMAFSAGDIVVYRPEDASAGQDQRIELDNVSG